MQLNKDQVFEWCVNELLSIEGGYSYHKADRGGATNFGITRETYSAFLGSEATIEQVKLMTVETAKMIYRAQYYDNYLLDQFKDKRISLMMFDQIVNRGPRSPVKDLQTSLNVLLKETDIKEDGKIGIKTINAANACDPVHLGMLFCERCDEAYTRIAEFNSSQLQFLRGWQKRVNKIRRLFWEAK